MELREALDSCVCEKSKLIVYFIGPTYVLANKNPLKPKLV
jgi:hypothetical protein